MKSAILTGQTDEHVKAFEGGVLVHQKVIGPLKRLKAKAEKEGIEIRIASAFRDFGAQLKIWNAKCVGLRPVLDRNGNPIDIKALSPRDLIFAILRWSALPGGSRHHWGTDLDVFDAGACPKDYRVELIPQEAEPTGPFFEFSRWLEKNAGSEGFFRPYREDLGGVSPEWWHISYEPISRAYQEALTFERLRSAIEPSEMHLKSEVLDALSEIYDRFIRSVCVK